MTDDPPAQPRALWIPALATLGLAWNAFGLWQFAGAVTASRGHLIGMGMTPQQADVHAGLPLWMDAAFGLGVAGGLAGCVLLILRRRLATPVLAASLAGYAALNLGDIVHGVFAAFGVSQVAILTLVLAIAAGLLGLSRRADRLPRAA